MSDSDFEALMSPEKKEGPTRVRTVRGAAGQKYKVPPQEPEPPPQSRRERILGLLNGGALALYPIEPADTATLVIHGDNIATSGAELAASDERFAKFLDNFLQKSPYATFFTAIGMTLLQIAANHGFIPDAIAQKIGLYHRDQLREQADLYITAMKAKFNLNGAQADDPAATPTG
jgi:hypothetical protein